MSKSRRAGLASLQALEVRPGISARLPITLAPCSAEIQRKNRMGSGSDQGGYEGEDVAAVEFALTVGMDVGVDVVEVGLAVGLSVGVEDSGDEVGDVIRIDGLVAGHVAVDITLEVSAISTSSALSHRDCK